MIIIMGWENILFLSIGVCRIADSIISICLNKHYTNMDMACFFPPPYDIYEDNNNKFKVTDRPTSAMGGRHAGIRPFLQLFNGARMLKNGMTPAR